MYEKILLKLKEQRGTTSNVSDRSLEDMAKSLVSIITTDDLLALTDLSGAIASIDGNINHYTSEAVKKAKEEEEKEKVKKAEEEIAKKAEEAKKKKVAKGKGEEIPEYAQALMDQNKLILEQNQTFADNLNALKQEKETSKRGERLSKVLNGLPEYLVTPIKESFKTALFKDEEAFSTYLQQVEKSGKTFEQQAKEQGLNTDTPSVTVKKPVDNGETKELSSARELVNKLKKEENATNSSNK